jgi:hypothetical protein
MKTIILIAAIFIIASPRLFAQEVPTLKEKDLLEKSDLKKRTGWLKVSLDSNFRETSGTARYEYFEFVNKKGQYNSTYTHALPLSNRNNKIIYTEEHAENKSILLNGRVSFYNKENKLILQYIFRNGFYVKACDWNKAGGVNTLIEYLPKKNSVELFANYFNAEGKMNFMSHEENDGYSYKTLPEQKTISPISN